MKSLNGEKNKLSIKDYKELYKLQDKVMKIIFGCENIFYLTGGTCLNRFYINKRYSDDLDFFTNRNQRFSFAVYNIIDNLAKELDVKIMLQLKDFHRIMINNQLQVDFINDVEHRLGDINITKEGFIIDNVFNILSSKITAVLGRDDPKDIFDIFFICKFYDFSWDEILTSAHLKLAFSDDDLIIKLKSFPSNLLKSLQLIDPNCLDDFEKYYQQIIEEITIKKNHKKSNFLS